MKFSREDTDYLNHLTHQLANHKRCTGGSMYLELCRIASNQGCSDSLAVFIYLFLNIAKGELPANILESLRAQLIGGSADDILKILEIFSLTRQQPETRFILAALDAELTLLSLKTDDVVSPKAAELLEACQATYSLQ